MSNRNPVQDVQRRARVREFVRAFKETHSCRDCGMSYPHYVMDFDHVFGVKTADVSDLMSRGSCSIHRIQTEITKCQLVCANCHRKRTFLRQPPRSL